MQGVHGIVGVKWVWVVPSGSGTSQTCMLAHLEIRRGSCMCCTAGLSSAVPAAYAANRNPLQAQLPALLDAPAAAADALARAAEGSRILGMEAPPAVPQEGLCALSLLPLEAFSGAVGTVAFAQQRLCLVRRTKKV